MPETEETIDIENAGNAVALRLLGATIVSVYIEGQANASYQVDVRRNGGSWIQDVGDTYAASPDADDVIETGVEELRVRCSSGSGGSGDQATITIMAG
jgi:hypothetical protein